MRLAHAIGLHLYNDAPSLSDFLKDMCARTWYSICYLESTLCMITGRPSALQDGESSMSIPQSENRGLSAVGHSGDIYFSVIVNLTTQSTKVLRELYSVFSMIDKKNWSEVQGAIRSLQDGLERWRLALPDSLRFEVDLTANLSLQVIPHIWNSLSRTICPLLHHGLAAS